MGHGRNIVVLSYYKGVRGQYELVYTFVKIQMKRT